MTFSEVIADACEYASWIAIYVSGASAITVGAAEVIHFTAAREHREKKADRNVYRDDHLDKIAPSQRARETS
jgi:hypothetical protein